MKNYNKYQLLMKHLQQAIDEYLDSLEENQK